MVYLTRRASFSAAHRLWSKQLSDEENYAVYDKCANPNGHGHNYVLEVTARGTPHPQTGMVLNLTSLKDAMQAQVLGWVHYKHVKHGVPRVEGFTPTAESLS